MGIFDFFKRKNKNNGRSEINVNELLRYIPENSSKELIPEYEFSHDYDPDKKSIIILDDNAGIVDLFGMTLESNQDKKYAQCQFINFTTEMAVFMLKRELENNNIRNVVGAILDITIGGMIVEDGVTKVLDGVDAYMLIKNKFPDAEIRFYTAHSMNRKNYDIYRFIKKFEDATGEKMEDYTYHKNPFKTSRSDILEEITHKACTDE